MRLPYTHNLSLMLEEMSRRDDGAASKCLQIMLYQTLADKLWKPFNVLCFNPFITLVVVVVLYLIFCIIYAPLWLASLIVTSYGAFALFLVFINYLANLISRKIAFAGSNISIKKQISAEFFKRVAMFLESNAVLISDFTAILLLGASGQIPFQEMPPMDQKLKEVSEKVPGLNSLTTLFRQSISFLTSELTATPTELLLLNQLCTAVEEQIGALLALQPIASAYIVSLESFRRANHAQLSRNSGRGGFGASMQQQQQQQLQAPKGTPELFKVASHCIKMSKALKVAIDNCKPPPAVVEDDGGIVSKIKSVLNLNEGLEGCEKITFPYMRCMLKQRFQTEQFTLIGCDKNTIDGVIFPCTLGTNAAAASSGNYSSTHPETAIPQQQQQQQQQSPVGIVLFCSPNAAFYEGMCQCEPSTSWLGYYMQKGYDVCMFNYRGYGLSSGDPHPHSIKRDAEQVYEHLQRTRRPYRIIVHGESIGGMVACHLARTRPVDALICDRTFSTLDATAARLMGKWAGLGLKYCTLWSTNVARDYLACTCPKIILQDPDDEIIANLASLKNGVAMRLVLGDLDWQIRSEPWEYTYATYCKEELPHKEQEAAMLLEAGDAGRMLTERFVTHFYACVADLARRSAYLTSSSGRASAGRRARAAAALSCSLPGAVVGILPASTPRRPPSTHSAGGGGGSGGADHHDKPASSGGSSSLAGSAELSRRTSAGSAGCSKENVLEDGYASSHSSRHDSKDFTFEDEIGEGGEEEDGADEANSPHAMLLDVMGLRSLSGDIVAGEHEQQQQQQQEGGCMFRDVESGEESGQSPSSSSSQSRNRRHALRGVGGGTGGGRGPPISKKERLEQFCSTPMRDPVPALTSSAGALGPAALTKAWAAVGRIDGGSGQLLGQAVSGGLEGVRAWLCAWLVWSKNAARDMSLPTGCTDMATGARDLQLLTAELHVSELQHDRAVQFLKSALEALVRRRDVLVFHKPPMGLMLQGALSFNPLLAEGVAQGYSEEEISALNASLSVGGAAAGSGSAVLGAEVTSPAGVLSGETSPLMLGLGAMEAMVRKCLCSARQVLASNPYASIDACGDLDRVHCPSSVSSLLLGGCVGGRGGAGAGRGGTCSYPSDREAGDMASLRTSCTLRGDALLSGVLCSSVNVPSPQHMPYVGEVIALHSGHNGWPVQSELAALTDFLVQTSLA